MSRTANETDALFRDRAAPAKGHPWRWHVWLVVQILPLSVLSVAAVGGSRLALDQLWPALALTAIVWLASGVLLVAGYRGDALVLPVVGAMLSVSLGAVMGVDRVLGVRQLVWMALGLACLLGTYALVWKPYRLARYKYTAAIAGLFVVALTLVIGRDLNDSGLRLWIGFGPFQFQPAELLKLLLVVFFAGYLYEFRPAIASGSYTLGPLRLPPLPYLAPLLALWGTSIMLFAFQRDFGAAALVFGVAVAMLYIASGRPAYVFGALAAFVAGALLCYRFVPVVERRVQIWLDPWSQADAAGYQVVQGLISLASGSVLGGAPGAVNPTVVPAAATDYIIAVVGEHLGLAGTLALVALYLVLFQRGFTIAIAARGEFEQLLAAGITIALALQTVVILAGTLKLAPLTGITLPMVSYGGSSLVANCIMLGLLLRLSQESAHG